MNEDSSYIAERVRRVIADELGIERSALADNARFKEDLGADELDKVELIMALEEEFGEAIQDSDAAKILSTDGAIKFILGRLEGKEA